MLYEFYCNETVEKTMPFSARGLYSHPARPDLATHSQGWLRSQGYLFHELPVGAHYISSMHQISFSTKTTCGPISQPASQPAQLLHDSESKMLPH